MKATVILMVIFLTTIGVNAQDVSGKWYGIVEVPGASLPIVFNIEETDDGFVSTLDSPDQGAYGIEVKTTTFVEGILTIEIPGLFLKYSGEFENEEIKGTFSQAGFDTPLILTRNEPEKKPLQRPQEPTPPFPYHSEDVIFKNKEAGIKLAGTLTFPYGNKKHPAVVLITGSGAQNRNQEIFGHKPFLVLSDYLTRHGIAVLRFDDRGYGESEGDFSIATSQDFASDVQSAFEYLMTRPEIDSKQIGLIGHSEGGMIAPMVAAKNEKIAFIVLLAGTGMKGSDLLHLQVKLISRASGMQESEIEKSLKINRNVFNIVSKTEDINDLKSKLEIYYKSIPSEQIPGGVITDDIINYQVNMWATPWMRFFLNHNPINPLKLVKCPVLAVNGEKDLQVPPIENLQAIEEALLQSGNKSYKIVKFDGLNHLFQECETGLPSEYSQIEQTFAPVALDEITKWILTQTISIP
ncbi:alpha/beta hydrolase family protein [Alkalitalea saponilacus]|uniref:Serine aminopeptidase S33 domain-containing protein n=1 Tax=Alkalitalea saponilacus TaxID=889453 RepID=A0A1T5D3R5_9BACT|nr:alpha/beta hydrolase [Alkalitalea saponilacus]ASB50562.1 alpha/beta hydrolase [Alkalitalea saponilacus]SKB66233.1 hypothetical protein SAMN03080601_00958 [Alkalitalea saponilacus]